MRLEGPPRPDLENERGEGQLSGELDGGVRLIGIAEDGPDDRAELGAEDVHRIRSGPVLFATVDSHERGPVIAKDRRHCIDREPHSALQVCGFGRARAFEGGRLVGVDLLQNAFARIENEGLPCREAEVEGAAADARTTLHFADSDRVPAAFDQKLDAGLEDALELVATSLLLRHSGGSRVHSTSLIDEQVGLAIVDRVLTNYTVPVQSNSATPHRQTVEGDRMSIVDVHAHHLPVSLGERFTALSGRPYPLRHSDDHSRRLADLDEAEVDRQILGLGAVQPYWADRSASVDGARFANDLYARIALSEPRFAAFGAVPLPHPDEATDEAARCLDELGFAGIGLGCSADGVPLDDDRLDPFWAELDARSAIVYLHPGVANDGLVGVGDYPMLLGPVFGSPAEQAVAITRLVLKGKTQRFRNIRFVIYGMGGILLVSQSKLADSLERGKLLGHAPDATEVVAEFDRLWFDTSSIDPILSLAARETGSIDRLVFGSDSPWGSAVKVSNAMRENLSPEECDAVRARAANLLSHGKENS